MKSIIQAILIISSMATISLSAHAAQDNSKIYLDDLDYLYEMGKDIYSYWDLKKRMYGTDWDELYADARSEMKRAKGLSDYQRIMLKMISSVRDGHVNFWFTNRDSKSPYYMPIALRDCDGKIIISAIKNDSLEYTDEIEVGDELIAINGVKVEDRINYLSQYRSGSTPQMIRRGAIRLLTSSLNFESSPSNAPLLTIIKRKSGETRNVEIPWLIYNSISDSTIPKEPFLLADHIEAKILPDNIGYLMIDTMYPDINVGEYISYIEEQISYLRSTDSLIIDVRGNGGGNSIVGETITSHFIDKPVSLGKQSMRLSLATLLERPSSSRLLPDPSTDGAYSQWENNMVEPALDGITYLKPIAVLINSACFSACDTFVDGLVSNNIAIAIGESTGGGTGYPLEIRLPSGLSAARFSTWRGWSNSGHMLEGRGTTPKIEAHLSADDIARGVDSVLETARKYLAENLIRANKSNSAQRDRPPSMKSGIPELKHDPILPASILDEMEREENGREASY